MANTKQLLDAQDLDPILDGVEIKQLKFTPKDGDGSEITYNRLVLNFTNGDNIMFRLEPEQKMSLYFALREIDTK